tara:strand:+ start:5198 stop:5392 length:195 start_codon:yes stop_codon:yes gene_type:complete
MVICEPSIGFIWAALFWERIRAIIAIAIPRILVFELFIIENGLEVYEYYFSFLLFQILLKLKAV